MFYALNLLLPGLGMDNDTFSISFKLSVAESIAENLSVAIERLEEGNVSAPEFL